jgi:integrase
MTPPNHFILARPFIESAVLRCVDRTAYSNAELHHACGRLVLFVGTQPDVGLTDSAVFSAPTIEAYIATLTELTSASRGNLRSMLYRMSEVILGTTGKGDISYALSASSPSEPYSREEVALLNEWFAAQGNRQTDAAALLGLGFGAGLSSAEIVALKPSDLDVEPTAEGTLVFVHVKGLRARRVLVDHAYSKFVVAAWEARQKSKWLFAPGRNGAGKNLISNFVARGPDAGLRPNTQRMRATYLVKHIAAGDSVTELMRIAGVQSLDALARYVRFVG